MADGSQNVDLLRDIALFVDLSADELTHIAERCRWIDCAAGRQIIDHLDDTTDCFLIASGSVRVIVNSSSGKEITFRDIGAGEVVGELSALDGRPRSASVVALTDARIARLSSTDLWDILQRNPDAAAVLIRRLTALVRQMSDRVVAITALPVGPRVQVELLRLALDVGVTDNRAVILGAPTHAEIASRVAARREAVTREISRLADAGIVDRHGRDLVVTDVAALRSSVEALLDITPT
ncbi:MAG: Crp/Fnr family transcriptional regulator [Alphaproteobacteria bacterium]|nr:Crp/Fnr family transcriptional regulator [Alphaproteobacteria bacterium]